MSLARNLRVGCAGSDVRALKERLFVLNCYAPHIIQLRSDEFGFDTLDAVRRFQRENGLIDDGVVGALTWEMLLHAGAKAPEEAIPAGAIAPEPDEPANHTQSAQVEFTNAETDAEPHFSKQIGATAREAILPSLATTTAVRRAIVLDALQFAFDRSVPASHPVSLYIRGGNLYNSNLLPNVITLSRIAAGAKRQPQYYDGGRREMMEQAVRANPNITGADCSGGVVGLLRHVGVVKSGFDLSADGFDANRRYQHILQSGLLPADILHKKGHVGLYVGGGYAVEWMGGAFGCQLTKLTDRRGYNFVTKRVSRMGAWTGFLRPTYY